MIDVSSLSVRRVKENRYVADAYGLRNALPTINPFDGPRSTMARGDTPKRAVSNLLVSLRKDEYRVRLVNDRLEFDR